MPKISIIIPVFNRWDLTKDCLLSLKEHTSGDFEILVVDNASSDSTEQACPYLGRKLFGKYFFYIRNDQNRNFAGACNQGAKEARGDFLFFLNNDTLATQNYLPPLIETMTENKQLCGVGPLLLYPEFLGMKDVVQHLGVVVEPEFYVRHLYEGFPKDHPVCQKKRLFRIITAAALLLPKQRFLEAGLFDEGFVNGGEDVELCLRMTKGQAGFMIDPSSVLYHLGSQSPGRHDHEISNGERFREKSTSMLVPDFHIYVGADGYSLKLNDHLAPYVGLPQKRKAFFAKYCAKLKTPEALHELLKKEPLCLEAYLALVDYYIKLNDIAQALTIFARATFFLPTKSLLEQYLALAKQANETITIERITERLIKFDHESKNVVKQRAESLRMFWETVDNKALVQLYDQWLSDV